MTFENIHQSTTPILNPRKKWNRRAEPEEDDEEDRFMKDALKLAVAKMSQPAKEEDQWDTFASFVANEIRNLKKEELQHKLKRAIQKTMMDFVDQVTFNDSYLTFNDLNLLYIAG